MLKSELIWHSIKDGYPDKDLISYFDGTYSIPVLVGNEHSGQVAEVAYRWDYVNKGWLYSCMCAGPDIYNYDVQHVSHWAILPRIVKVDPGVIDHISVSPEQNIEYNTSKAVQDIPNLVA